MRTGGAGAGATARINSATRGCGLGSRCTDTCPEPEPPTGAEYFDATGMGHRAHFGSEGEVLADSKLVVTASHNNTAIVWDAATGAIVAGPLEHKRSVLHAAFSPDGNRVRPHPWTVRRCGTLSLARGYSTFRSPGARMTSPFQSRQQTGFAAFWNHLGCYDTRKDCCSSGCRWHLRVCGV